MALHPGLPRSPCTVLDLAQRLERNEPIVAGKFYLRIAQTQLQAPQIASSAYPKAVALLKRAARLLPAAQWQPATAALRAAYARKPKLLQLMTEAGL